MLNLVSLLPHCKKDNKVESKESKGATLNELVELRNCSYCLFFEGCFPAVSNFSMSKTKGGIESLNDLTSTLSSIIPSPQAAAWERGRMREALRRMIKQMQTAVSASESCWNPVITAVDSGCIGGGIDLITACDIRVCTEAAFFSVKEVDLVPAADLGMLQRLPALVGFGNAADLALTGRRFSGEEARALGLVQRVFPSRITMEEGAQKMAADIAGKSPLAAMGTKAVLLQSMELTVEQGLDYVATWNSTMLLGLSSSHVLLGSSRARAYNKSSF